MFAHRLRRWPNIETALVECPVFAGYEPCRHRAGRGPRVVVSTAAFHARARGSVPGLGGSKETKMFLPHPRVRVSIVGSLRDREVACSASDRQGSNFESCVWRTVSSQSCHHPQEVLLAQFSLYVHKGGLKPDSFHFCNRAVVACLSIEDVSDKNLRLTVWHVNKQLQVQGIIMTLFHRFKFNPYCAEIDFSRQNLTSVVVKFGRLKSIPAL